MNFALNFVKGLIIGVGAIAPGVSGGSLAVMLGIYEKLTEFIANVIYCLKHNFKFFLAVGLGGCIGVLGFSRIIEYLFIHYEAQIKYLFIGLIVGTLPSVFRHANKNGFKRIYILVFVISLALTLFLAYLEKSAVYVNEAQNSLPWLVFYGVILGFGSIIPGISSSFILMYLGAYEEVLGSIARIDFTILIPIAVGFCLSIFLFAKLVQYLLKKAFGYTYYAILGFVLSSVVTIFPGFEFNIEYLLCFVLFIVGFYLSLCLGKLEKIKNLKEGVD